MSDDFCPRQIVFTIPGNPSVEVTATEHDGTIEFSIDVLESNGTIGDLRSLFFDINEAKLPGLAIASGDGLMSGSQIAANSVNDLGHGSNIKGVVKGAFDVGLAWGRPGIGQDGGIGGPVTFTLSNTAGNLTLDDIAHQRFAARASSTGDRGGPQKIETIAPAAPDANDDSYDVFEDGADGLNDPSKSPTDIVLDVLANDTDGDGDALTITSIHEQPEHGTITISADGKSLIYTPELDYAGTVSVEYCVSDGNGGQDSALVTIDIEAVADDPVVTWTVAQGATINEMIITVTATQDDADSSEFLGGIVASVAGGMPAGATLVPGAVNPGGEPDQIVQEFILTTAAETDYDFDLEFTANSVETSNGDTESATAVVPIVIDYNTATQDATFTATDQSIWSSGDEFTFLDDRFIGVDTGEFNESIGGGLYAGIEGHIKLGFQSTLEFSGGDIDAVTDYDLTVETTFNRTTDWLFIDTSALLTNALFDTQGPEGSYTLDFLYDVFLNAYAGVDLTILEVGIQEEIDLATITVGPGSFNILDLDSESLGGTITLPPPLDSLSADFAWPHLTTTGGTPLPLDSSGASNNFLQLNLDVDQLISQIAFGGINPFDPPRLSAGPFFADADLLDVDVSAGLNFLQDFLLEMGDVFGTIVFEDGSSQGFTFGDELFFGGASLIDDAGDDDGLVEFTFFVGPDADLTNQTAVGINVGVDIALLTVELGYDIEIASDSITLGPLAEFGAVAPVAEIPVFNEKFDLAFSTGDYMFAA
jgi:hypothetical protein